MKQSESGSSVVRNRKEAAKLDICDVRGDAQAMRRVVRWRLDICDVRGDT